MVPDRVCCKCVNVQSEQDLRNAFEKLDNGGGKRLVKEIVKVVRRLNDEHHAMMYAESARQGVETVKYGAILRTPDPQQQTRFGPDPRPEEPRIMECKCLVRDAERILLDDGLIEEPLEFYSLYQTRYWEQARQNVEMFKLFSIRGPPDRPPEPTVPWASEAPERTIPPRSELSRRTSLSDPTVQKTKK